MTKARPATQRARLKLAVRGAVQGVGFRPFVFRLAQELGLSGWVNNSPLGVFIEAEGSRLALDQFVQRLDSDKPPRSFIQSLESAWLDPAGYEGFEIRHSESSGARTALVLPDIATCPECLEEIRDRANRRYGYPFTNCTHCGPRFSIIKALPYDRANTSMCGFKMCPDCQAEYDDPTDRRFHAQPNACPSCGPRLELWDSAGTVAGSGPQALQAAAEAIRRGQIAAVKGVGGFHLLADARNAGAIRRLRERKHREEKPFALMIPTLASVREVCEVCPVEARRLCSPEAPIVLLRKIANPKSEIVREVAPGNPYLGVMLPSNPLHHLLMTDLGFPVVATSGNLSDEPICTDEREALERLGGIADVFLVHNRPIVRHVDDSIVRVMLDREMVLRRARGYAPLPIHVAAGRMPAGEPGFQPCGQDVASPAAAKHSNAASDSGADPGGKMPPSTAGRMPAATILAVGAHLKNSVALSIGEQVFISQHIGDLESEQANQAFRRVIADLEALYEAAPGVVAADLHPDYLSTKFAANLAGRADGPTQISVQHHIAHVLSCIAENELEGPVLGVAWDGTGYGPDGTIWGGEFFLVTDKQVERVAHLRPFRLPGSDTAVKEPRRAALGLLHELEKDSNSLPVQAKQKVVRTFPIAEASTLETMLKRGLNSPWTSSVGRLFDAVVSLIGLRQETRFEGQAAMELEFAMEGIQCDEHYDLPVATDRPPFLLDWAPMILAMLTDVQRGESTGRISAKFHNALAEGVLSVARKAGERRVALSGGCFQNRHLTERTVTRLREEGYQPYWHQRVPPNDGGIALGQVAAARRAMDAAAAEGSPGQPGTAELGAELRRRPQSTEQESPCV